MSCGTVLAKQLCPVGTPEYIAPEILSSLESEGLLYLPYGKSSDYWSVGIMAFRFIFGDTPFSADTTAETYHNIIHFARLKIPAPENLSGEYRDFIKRLLEYSQERLTHEGILTHPLFKNIKWENLDLQNPPFTPALQGPNDTVYFQGVTERKLSPCMENYRTKSDYTWKQLPFVGYTYTQCQPTWRISRLRRSERQCVAKRKREKESLQRQFSDNDSDNANKHKHRKSVNLEIPDQDIQIEQEEEVSFPFISS